MTVSLLVIQDGLNLSQNKWQVDVLYFKDEVHSDDLFVVFILLLWEKE